MRVIDVRCCWWRSSTLTIGVWFIFAVSMESMAHAQVKLVFPLGGVPNQDWAIGNYVDVDPRPGVRADYRGGSYTYDGHNALDMGLPHFRRMDEGVQVRAAADGVVQVSLDGAYDRWSGSNPAPSGEVGNYLSIDHGGGLNTNYAHLKKGSVLVDVGDTVVAGQLLAEVGSSGQSSGPHLHFSVYQNGRPIETFQNPDLWWYDPLPYTGETPSVLDAGVSDHWPTSSELDYGLLSQPVFPPTDSLTQLAVMWDYFSGIPVGSDISFSFRQPNGIVSQSQGWTTSGPNHAGLWYVGAEIPVTRHPGLWNAEFRVNGQLLSSRSFRVGASVPEPTSGSTMGVFAILVLAGRLRSRTSGGQAVLKPQ